MHCLNLKKSNIKKIPENKNSNKLVNIVEKILNFIKQQKDLLLTEFA